MMLKQKQHNSYKPTLLTKFHTKISLLKSRRSALFVTIIPKKLKSKNSMVKASKGLKMNIFFLILLIMKLKKMENKKFIIKLLNLKKWKSKKYLKMLKNNYNGMRFNKSKWIIIFIMNLKVKKASTLIIWRIWKKEIKISNKKLTIISLFKKIIIGLWDI
jgi:hypothetical protein